MRALNVAGRVLLGLGVLVLLFTAYQLWGTGLGEQHSQSLLRSRLQRELPRQASSVAHHLATTGTKGTSGTGGATTTALLAPTTAPPATGQPIGQIDIPKIGLDQVVVEGVTATQLRTGPGHYPGTSLPGQAGNAAIAGHRTTYAHPFYSLDAVVPGDQIFLTTPQGVFVYTAVSQRIVPPTDVAVIADTTTPTLTLTTCNPRYSAATRLVVHADLTRSRLFGISKPPAAGHRPTASPVSSHAATGGLAGTGGSGSVPIAVAWGAAVLAVGLATLLVASRSGSRRRRWAVHAVGLVACLGVLFFFFGAVSPLLPASL